MRNSNQAINYSQLLNNIISISLFILLTLFSKTPVFSQTQLPLPDQFKSITINSRALEKDFELTANKNLNSISQSIALDKTGLILHLVPSPKIKNNNTKLRVISDDGTELEIFTFTDGTFFTLVDSAKTYSIIQEIIPDCNLIKGNFSFDDNTTTICPDSIAYKIYSNIMILTDTSFRITLKTPTEFYSIPLLLPENTEQIKEQSFINISTEGSQTSESNVVNISKLLTIGELCLVSSTLSSSGASDCSFSNSSINIITSYKDNLKIGDTLSNNNTDLLATFIINTFKTLQHEFIFKITDSTETTNESTAITLESPKKLFLDTYNYNLTLNLGTLKKGKTVLKKNIFTLKNPFEINSLLNQLSLMIPVNSLEGIVNLFSDPKTESVLTNISISSDSVNSSINNNIVVSNLLEPTPTPSLSTPTPTPTPKQSNTQLSQLTQTSQTEPTPSEEAENINIKIYFPNNTKNITFSKTYTFVEQNTAPSVDEKGKAIEIINNKSRIDYKLSKELKNLEPSNDNIAVELESISSILKDKNLKNPVNLTGYLIPPDFRPILETGYRATFEVSMIILLDDLNSIDLMYSDLKTMDETPLTNFFKFDFVPQGIYNAVVKFDADRKKFFSDLGILKKNN